MQQHAAYLHTNTNNSSSPLAASFSRHTNVQQTPTRRQDSSTSNEIFSRRRGLQQHQRAPAGAPTSQQLSFDELLAGKRQPLKTTTNQNGATWSAGRSDSAAAELLPPPPHQTNQTSAAAPQVSGNGINNSLLLRQMEENKRKYVRQQQDSLRSPTLSAQKANQIKAKLGLLADGDASPRIVSPHSSGAAAKRNKQLSDSAASGSANEPTHEDPPQQELAQFSPPADFAASQQQLIGAPLSTIPKTDFECTDKRGRFVSGLFADSKTGCQVWHLCSNNRKYSFLCPSGTIFSAKLRICDWRYNVKCENTMP